MEIPYKIGDVVEGIITNVLPYGAFVHIDSSTTGLIHISEITNGFVSDIHHFVTIGQRVFVKVLEVDDQKDQLRLSLKSAPREVKSIRRRRSRVLIQRKQLLPASKIGFRSLQDKLPEWIKEQQHD